MLDKRPFTPPVAVAAPYSVVPPSSSSSSAASSTLSPAQYNLNAIRASSAKPSPPVAANFRTAPGPGRSAIELNDDDVGSDIDDGDESVDQLLISNLAAATSRPASSVRLGAHSHSQPRSQSSHPPSHQHQQSSPADARITPAALHLALPAASFRSAPTATFASMPVARPIMTPMAGGAGPAALTQPAGHSTPGSARSDLDLQYGAFARARGVPRGALFSQIRVMCCFPSSFASQTRSFKYFSTRKHSSTMKFGSDTVVSLGHSSRHCFVQLLAKIHITQIFCTPQVLAQR